MLPPYITTVPTGVSSEGVKNPVEVEYVNTWFDVLLPCRSIVRPSMLKSSVILNVDCAITASLP